MRGRRRFRTAVAAATAALLCAGALAGCSSGTPERPAPARSAPVPSPTPTSSWNASPSSLAAVGDSITRAFDACSLLSDCPEASWATGTDTAVNSLALRLLGPEKAAGRSWNLARTGARMADLPGQMTAAAARKPELVTVMMGANDACRPTPGLMTPVAEFRASFAAALARLRTAAPEARVYVASVPDLKHLWSTGRTGGAAGVWDLGICGAMLADATDLGPEAERRRTTVSERVDAYNGVLAEVCAKDEHCRYDGGAVHRFRFDGAQLSPWDWFHPSRDGQARLAELAYRRITAE
ncbi:MULTISPECIES: SGNH/GDSL hydrolase family protein [unclassified Streptomyces]|uniref:SGNH/GDSL hydrolase family protein n=1 Tax=unclassified Streptomyces TaxID=2593676 RepID=UPI0006AF4926|nr:MULTISPECIES: SGNH/GDSL hydrolase family protein [unclassified Streptomyces]KOX30807.1 lipoprotein [Streptomyces sp. NRRL F-6491]KOX38842.1 lipoprotein [Streptomyces sp. NRRL F-6492]